MKLGGILALAGMVPLLAGLAACGGQRPADKVVLALYKSPRTATLLIAEDKGYFKDEGLDVAIDTYDTGQQALEALLAGKADIATVADTPVAQAALDGKQLWIIASYSRVERAVSIVGRRDRGIATFSDLKGKAVGTTPGTIADYFLQSYLINAGVDPKSVEAVNLTPSQYVDSVVSGNVDAVAAAAPQRGMLIEKLGANAVVLDNQSVLPTSMVAAATPALVEADPDVIQRFLRAIIRADQFIQDNPEEAESISADSIGADAVYYQSDWPDYSFEVVLDESLVMSLEEQARWTFASADTTKAMPNILDFIYADGLKAARPEAVTIVGE